MYFLFCRVDDLLMSHGKVLDGIDRLFQDVRRGGEGGEEGGEGGGPMERRGERATILHNRWWVCTTWATCIPHKLTWWATVYSPPAQHVCTDFTLFQLSPSLA